MSDATRVQAIQWCKDNNCDFKKPVFPPPDGWLWAAQGDHLTLDPIFTMTDQGDELTLQEVQKP